VPFPSALSFNRNIPHERSPSASLFSSRRPLTAHSPPSLARLLPSASRARISGSFPLRVPLPCLLPFHTVAYRFSVSFVRLYDRDRKFICAETQVAFAFGRYPPISASSGDIQRKSSIRDRDAAISSRAWSYCSLSRRYSGIRSRLTARS